jgi:ABC-2 type transport system ATP-binding protein
LKDFTPFFLLGFQRFADDGTSIRLYRSKMPRTTGSSLSDALIHCQKLGKRYGTHDVLHSVDFQIEAGQLVGFLGPNGAGKTTTIRILLGLLKPTSGQSTIFGRSSQADGKSIRQQIGYLPGDVHLYSNMTGRKTLEFFGRARGLNCNLEIDRLSAVLDLELDKTVRTYSTGMKQKLGLIQALMHKPKLVVLDEPTSALDPLIRKAVFQELQDVVDDGRSVLFSSHSLSEVEELCDEVIILRSGKIVEHQKIDSLKNRAIRRIQMVFSSVEEIPKEFPSSFQLFKDGGKNHEKNSASVAGTWTGGSNELIQWLAGQDVADLVIEKPDLNDLFMTYYE